MNLYIVTSGEMTGDEDASDLLIRASDENAARTIARNHFAYAFGDDDRVRVCLVSAVGVPGVLEEFRRPV